MVLVLKPPCTMVYFLTVRFHDGSYVSPLIELHNNLGERVIFRLFFTGGIQEFARSLAEDIARRYPAAIANSPEPPVSQRRRSEILGDVFSQATLFSLKNKLGILARIRMESALKWRLKEMGYDENFIALATEYLLASIARKPK